MPNQKNVHQRSIDAPPGDIGELINSLSERDDALWPARMWPRMALGASLGVGAAGGHGPIRYFVEEFNPGWSVKFRFAAPTGFDGFHRFEVLEEEYGQVTLRHTLEMKTTGLAILSWPLFYRPLHDALIEDALAKAQGSLGLTPDVKPWSGWVRTLRWITTLGKANPQVSPRIRNSERNAVMAA